MARTKKGRAVNGDRLAVNLSSGYTAIIRRPSIQAIRMIQAKAEELFPLPEQPTQAIEAVTGTTYHVVDDTKDEARKQAEAEVEGQRNNYIMDYVYRKRLVIEGHEDEAGRQAIIEKFAEDKAEIEEFGTIDDEFRALDDWQFTLRTFVVADGPDAAAFMLASMKALDQDGIDEQEIRRRVSFF